MVSEDLGRNLLLQGQLLLTDDLMRGVERVTLDGMRRVAKEMVQKRPALSVYGNTKPIPSLDRIWEAIRKENAHPGVHTRGILLHPNRQ
jgi:hypothetical protein